MTHDVWILVCDASRARLFRDAPRGKKLVQIQELEHPESRERVRDLMADANGRKPVGPVPARSVQGQGGAYGRPGAEPDSDPKDVEAQKFARELAHVLEKGLQQHEYERLIIVAPPRFLGTLRDVVSSQVEKHIESTIGKDLTNLDFQELANRLQWGGVLSA
jgi:protein required for attachment to host cells